MRGVPLNPVTCKCCGSEYGAPKDQRCRLCRMLATNPRHKYFWTPKEDQRLRDLYSSAGSKRELTAAIDQAVRETGKPRHIVRLRAQTLGITSDPRRMWRKEEVEQLRELAGQIGIKAIARRLRRSHHSVAAKLERLSISWRLTEGYTHQDLCNCLGVSVKSVHRWIDRGMLAPDPLLNDRIPESQVHALLFKHPAEYSLRRVDEIWFKDLVFGTEALRAQPGRVLIDAPRNSSSLLQRHA